jgi:hypothetical protein
MNGLIDRSLSTLAPIFAVAFATHQPHYAFVAGLATALSADVSMAFSEGLSGTGADSGRLRLLRGGTLTARSVVITTGVTWAAAWRPPCRPSGGKLWHLPAPVDGPRRQGRAGIISDGGAAGAGLLAGPSDQQIHCCRVTGGCRRPVLARRAGGL